MAERIRIGCESCGAEIGDHDSQAAVVINYTNHNGIRSDRMIVPVSMSFKRTKWHGYCWTLTAVCLGKGVRDFAMTEIHSWRPANDLELEAALVRHRP